MSQNSTPDVASRPDRPRLVDYALYALVARCVFALGSAFAIYGARPEITRSLAKLHPDWSAAKLHDEVSSALKANVLSTLITIVLVLLMGKFIRDGRNWARWVFLVLAFLVTRDVLQVTAFFQYHDLAFRTLSGLTGLAAVAALLLMFMPSSSHFFRRPGATASLLGVFRPRPRPGLGAPAGDPVTGAAPAGEAGSVRRSPAAEPVSSAPPARDAGRRRPVPRAKSRKQAGE